jgi:hypothetical protein
LSENTPRSRDRWTDYVRTAALWLRDTGLGAFGFALVLVVAVSGWAASFIGLHQFGVEHMNLTDTTAWLVPITFDGAPAGLSIVVARAATHGRPATVWRLLIVAFTGLSSWINYEHIEDELGRLVASFMPPSAVLLFEGLMSEARQAAIRRRRALDGTPEAPKLHLARWLFAPWDTLMIVRGYVLWLGLPEGLAAAKEAEWEKPKRRMPWGATKAPRAAATNAPEGATAPATTGATGTLRSAATNTPRGAMAPATATPQSAATGAPRSATAPATGSATGPATTGATGAPQNAPQSAAMAATTAATTPATGAPQSAPVPATTGATAPAMGAPRNPRVTATVAPPAPATTTPTPTPKAGPKNTTKKTRKPAGSVTRTEAQQHLRDLYDQLGRRPLESEMTDVLEEIGSKFTSRQYANKLRGEIELKEPHLVALGSTNVTALNATGT